MRVSILKVSIVMSTYNGEKYVKEQLNSFTTQTVQPDELIIVDDCSNDSTYDILLDFKKTAPFKVIIKRNKENIGKSAFNGFSKVFSEGASMATGDIIFFSDQDDVWFPGKIEKHLEIYKLNNDIVTVINDAMRTNRSLKSFGLTQMSLFEILGFSLTSNIIGCCCSIKSEFLKFLLPVPGFASHDSIVANCCNALGIRYICKDVLQFYRRNESATMSKAQWFHFYNIVKKPNILVVVLASVFKKMNLLFSLSKASYVNEINYGTATFEFGKKILAETDFKNKNLINNKMEEIARRNNFVNEEINLINLPASARLNKVISWYKEKKIEKNLQGLIRGVKDFLLPIMENLNTKSSE